MPAAFSPLLPNPVSAPQFFPIGSLDLFHNLRLKAEVCCARSSRHQPKGYVLSSSPEFNAEQLAAARAASWHQNSEPLLTLDSIRDWLTASGIVLFTPRPLQLPVPAPSLVEAMLGAPNVGPTDGQIEAARSIVARLVAEGNALPLNLFGIPGDLPDFVVSAQVFSFIYTLRGDKAWKLPPTSASPLGLRIYEVLAEKGALSAAELASEVGRELTESAIQRSLTELWSNLRVLPLLPQGSGPTLWELTSRRFTKAIKAGINAGQPTALSALISLYLAQSLLATEDEVETFLSPLAARSRIREVLHALTGSRQLETVVLEGKTLLHIPGTLPEFPEIIKPEPTEEELAAAAAISAAGDEGRIKKFTSSSERRAFGDFKGKPTRTFGAKPGFGAGTRPTPRAGTKPAFGAKPEGERRPFRRDAADAKPSFTKPWNEDRKPEDRKPFERKPRPEADSGASKSPYTPRGASAGSAFPKRAYAPREGGATTGSFPKRPYTPRDTASSDRPARPSFGAKRAFGDKPAFRKTSGEGFSPRPRAADGERKPFERKPYPPRDGASSARPARSSFGAKGAFGDRGNKPSFGAKRPYASKPSFGDRDAKPASEGFTKFRKFDAPKRPFTPREDRGGRPDKPAYGGSDSKPRAPKEAKYEPSDRAGNPKRPFPRAEGDLVDRPVRPWPEKTGRSDGRPGGPGSKSRGPRKFDGGSDARPKAPFRSPSGEGPKPRGKFGSKPGGFSKRPAVADGKVSFGGKPAPRRGTPGVKPSYPRKPRSEE